MSQTEFLLSKNLITKAQAVVEGPKSKPLSPFRALFRALLLVMLTVLAGHATTMLLFRRVYFGHWEPLIESAMVIGFLFPVSYFYFFRPLVTQAEACRRAEQEVREQAQMLASAHDAIIVRDLHGCVRFWNQGAQRLLGWSPADVFGKKVSEFAYPDPAKFHEVTEAVLRNGEWQGELKSKTKKSNELTLSARMTLVRDVQGQPKSILTILWDITEQKELEAKFLRAQRLESIGVLAGGIAHDLNNILAPILMSAQILRMKRFDPETEEILQTIETSAQRGADVVKQVLTFSRGADGKRTALQLKHMIKEFAKMAQETFPKSITIRVDFDRDPWPALAEPTQIHQVLMNLAVNARDAMPKGGVLSVSIKNAMIEKCVSKFTGEVKPGPYVILQVSDSGTGIPHDIIDKIFDPFFTTKDLGKGTGLGLSTVLGIVKSHGGWIDLNTGAGHGTTFKIHLPAALHQAEKEHEAKPSFDPPGAGEVVLLVDDEVSFREIAQSVLKVNGYQTLLAQNGSEALTLFSQQPGTISVIVTDLMMPGIDGPALLRNFKKIRPDIKIIVATGLGTEEKINEIRSAGATHVLHKPFTAGQLLHAVHDAVTDNGHVKNVELLVPK